MFRSVPFRGLVVFRAIVVLQGTEVVSMGSVPFRGLVVFRAGKGCHDHQHRRRFPSPSGDWWSSETLLFIGLCMIGGMFPSPSGDWWSSELRQKPPLVICSCSFRPLPGIGGLQREPVPCSPSSSSEFPSPSEDWWSSERSISISVETWSIWFPSPFGDWWSSEKRQSWTTTLPT